MFDLARSGAAMTIGALPALADGKEARALTQEWARAIHEDQPAGPQPTGIRYRSGYNHGFSLALWDCDQDIEILQGTGGQLQDFALNDPRVLRRLQVEMNQRHIHVATVPEGSCEQCIRGTLRLL